MILVLRTDSWAGLGRTASTAALNNAVNRKKSLSDVLLLQVMAKFECHRKYNSIFKILKTVMQTSQVSNCIRLVTLLYSPCNKSHNYQHPHIVNTGNYLSW